MTNRPMLHAIDYADKEEFFSAIKEYLDKGMGVAYDVSGMSKQDIDWLFDEVSAYQYLARTHWDIGCDHSRSYEMAAFIPESIGGSKAYMDEVMKNHKCKSILRREAGA